MAVSEKKEWQSVIDEFFSEKNMMSEQVYGMHADQRGVYVPSERVDVNKILTEFSTLESAVTCLGEMIHGRIKMSQSSADLFTVTSEKMGARFDKTGRIPTGQFVCPQCGKRVDALQMNGYCSKTCGVKARLSKAASMTTNAGEKTLEIISMIQEKLQLLDLALDILSSLPDIIKAKVRLPEEYREYITLRIDIIFIRMKYYINCLMISKNMLLIELLKKVKFGVIDSKLAVLFSPITAVMEVAAGLQQALNTAMAAINAMLMVPISGIPPHTYGWFLTAKSIQHPLTAGKLCINIVPKANLALPIPNIMNNINYEAIDAICMAALPPIIEAEYFMDPTYFKVRWSLSQSNVPRLKKLHELLEALVVLGADTYPRYSRLKLSNVWFVIAILTGWGIQSRGVYGDFIFHGAI